MTTRNISLFWKYICLLIFTTQYVTFVACQTTDDITFTCDANGIITSITKPKIASNLIVIKKGLSYCHYDQISCTTKKETKLHVIIQSDNHTNIVAGHDHSKNLHYIIECKDEYDVIATAAPFFVSPSTSPRTSVVTMTAKPPPKLIMTINHAHKGVAGNVYIGEELTLEMSASGYKVYPKECTAFNSDDKSKADKVNIWTYKSLPSVDGKAKCSTYDPAITVENWTPIQPTNKSMSIPIYAFRFTTSPNVFIRCKAHLCPTSHLDCSSTCEKTTTQRRRRRSSRISRREEPKQITEEASVSFSVVSENHIPNKANALSVRFTVVVTSIVFGRQFLRFL